MLKQDTNSFRPVIGLEVHIQLRTKSKMFSSAPNDQTVTTPNTNVDEVVTAQPGSLPVANAEAVRLAALMGLALNCRIDEWSKFDRKHYFYPDLPKGYQISQYDQPIASEGWIDVEISNVKAQISNSNTDQTEGGTRTKRIFIQRAHLEEDAGKNIHPEGLPYSLVDYNRAGTPLLEIVTHPCIESAEEARKYLEELQRIARFVGASDADMEKGSMRCEPSISVRLPGEEGLPPYKVEVKNINSFKFVEQAITYEIARQSEMRAQGQTPKQVTMGWNEKLNKTVEQRSKEEANDYRYFPDPDLPVLQFTPEYLDELRKSLPELPAQKRLRYSTDYNLPASDIETLLNWKDLCVFFEQTAEIVQSNGDIRTSTERLHKLIKLAVNWCLQDFSAMLKVSNIDPQDSKVKPDKLAQMILLIESGQISSSGAKQVFKELFDNGGEPTEIVEKLGLSQVSDSSAIATAVTKVLQENPKAVEDYKAGQQKSFAFLVGQTMKELKGRGNPTMVNEVLKEKIDRS